MEEELKQKLFRNTESGWNETTPEQREEITALSDKYMAFLNKAKTEREFIKRAKELADQNGFRDIMEFETLKPGDKIYFINRGKSIYYSIKGIL